jgi:hypothetical protein
MFMNDIDKSLKRRASLTTINTQQGRGVYLGYTLTIAPGNPQ